MVHLLYNKNTLWYNERMLEPILASQSQSAILAFLCAGPERSFSATELQGRLRLSPLAASRALAALGRLNLVTTFRKGGHKYYLINSKHPRLPEIRKALPLRGEYRDELFVAIRKLGEIRAAFLSGIFTGQPQLPVDLLLVGKVNKKRLEQFLAACYKLFGQDINYTVMSDEEFQVRRDTFDRFIKDIFDYPNVVVVDTLSRKRPVKRNNQISFERFRVPRF